jgi:DNA polymerase-4
VSFNKTFAKLGSDMKKPDAITVIPKESFREKIWELPASDLIGIGAATSATLARFGIHTIGELARAYPPMLKGALGKNGLKLIEIANGRDESPVVSEEHTAPIKSMSHGTTTPRDLETYEEIKTVMLALCEELGHRLLSIKKKACTVVISLRNNQLVTRQYQCRLDMPTDSYSVIAKRAFELMVEKHELTLPLRSVSIGVNDLIPSSLPCQVDLFTDPLDTVRKETLDRVMNGINLRFGKEKIRYGLLYASTLSDVGEGFGFGKINSMLAAR